MVDESGSKVERFKRLERLYHSALELAAEERTTFLDHACAGDESLRLEVEALLAAQPQATAFLSVPVVEREARRLAKQLGDQTPNDNQPIAPPASLIGHTINQYEIVAPLGRGGMGEVWLAEDIRLKRKVALKLLPAEFTNDADRVRRFEQEAYAVSALNHPNIITLFDFGHAEEGYFITTEFVDGLTLRERLREGVGLPVREAIEIALQICSALGAAHEAGIIHRDIKPENVMLRRDGYVKTLDFGLAKVGEDQTLNLNTSVSNLTNPGAVMGTVSYMSPEQARAQKVDARTDIFSLGIVLYETLTGRLPFEGETGSDMLAAILKSEPLPLPDDLTAAPAALQQVIIRTLVKDREARYQTIRALADDLKQCAENLQFHELLARSGENGQSQDSNAPSSATHSIFHPRLPSLKTIFAFVLLILFVAIPAPLLVWRMQKPKPSPPSPASAAAPIRTLAVLPFRFLGSDRAEEYLGLGMTDTLITKLSSARQLTVRPTGAVLKYQNATAEPDRAARELKTDAVIDGSVQKAGDKLRVTVQLIRAGEAQPLWTDEFNESVNNLFALQEEIGSRIVEALRLSLSRDEQRQLTKRQTGNRKAYQHFITGRYHWDKNTPASRQKAIASFQQALAEDPRYALACAWMAAAYLHLGIDGESHPQEARSKAQSLALKTLEMDQTQELAHYVLGAIQLFFEWNGAGAELELKRAIDLNPNNVEGRLVYAYYLLFVGRTEEAVAEVKRGQQLDPLSLLLKASAASMLYYARRYDEAIAQCRNALELDPNFSSAYYWLALAYLETAKPAEAIAEMKQWIRLSGRSEKYSPDLAYLYAVSSQPIKARLILKNLLAGLPDESYADPFDNARIYLALGANDQALAWLVKAYEKRSTGLMWLKVNPQFDRLRSDVRFQDLLRRIERAP